MFFNPFHLCEEAALRFQPWVLSAENTSLCSSLITEKQGRWWIQPASAWSLKMFPCSLESLKLEERRDFNAHGFGLTCTPMMVEFLSEPQTIKPQTTMEAVSHRGPLAGPPCVRSGFITLPEGPLAASVAEIEPVTHAWVSSLCNALPLPLSPVPPPSSPCRTSLSLRWRPLRRRWTPSWRLFHSRKEHLMDLLFLLLRLSFFPPPLCISFLLTFFFPGHVLLSCPPSCLFPTLPLLHPLISFSCSSKHHVRRHLKPVL